jgi:hypothetical protein
VAPLPTAAFSPSAVHPRSKAGARSPQWVLTAGEWKENGLKAERAVLLEWVLLALLAPIAIGTTQTEDRLIPLAVQPGWNARASMSPDGQHLVFNDAANASLRVFDLQGRFAREVKSPGLGATNFNLPLYLSPHPSGFLVLDSTRLVWVDAELKPESGWILPDRSEPPGTLDVTGDRGPFVEVALWEACALDSRTAIVFGDFLDAKGWRKGVAKLRPMGDGGLRLDLLASEVVQEGSPSPYYLLPLNLHPSIAAAGREVYQLRFGTTASLERLLPSPRSIPLPKPFDGPLPLLGPLGGRENQPLLFARLGATPLPRSIHSWRGSIYLATSTPKPKGEVGFALWRWDEKLGWRGPMTLDTPPETREVALAPGASGVVALFKKAIVKPEEQELIGFRLLKPETLLGGLR